MIKFLFQAIQFSKSTLYKYTVKMSNTSIWFIEKILSGATSPVHSGPGNDENEVVLCIP